MTKSTDSAPIPTLPPLTMPLEEALRTQRVLRRLKPDPVHDALVLRLIELALEPRQAGTRRTGRLCWSRTGR